jgi:hypothetical protein
MEERMKDKRTRGRKRLQMLSDVVAEGTSYEQLKKEAEDRRWRKTTKSNGGCHKPAFQQKTRRRGRDYLLYCNVG